MAAAILVEAGETVNDAFTIVEQARGRSVPDTEEQREWVHKYAKMKAFFGAEIETKAHRLKPTPETGNRLKPC